MTVKGPRRPVSARDFNRLLFALLLLGGLTVMARLVTHQESQANHNRQGYTFHKVVRCYLHSRLLF